jgi:hypothetical protein
LSISSSSRSSSSAVLLGDHAAGLGDQALGHLAHLDDGRAELRRDRRLGVAPAGDPGHVAGQVAHPLEVRAHPQAGDDGAQVAGNRLLAREQVEGPPVQLVAQGVDGVVGGDHALRQRQVGVLQRRGGAVDRRSDQPGHLDQLVGQSGELLVVRVAHRAPFVVGRPPPTGEAASGERAAACQYGVNELGLPGEQAANPTE